MQIEHFFAINSPWPALFIVLYLMLLSYFVIRLIPFYQELVNGHINSHLPLEGLRGIFAVTIFIHHSVCAYFEQKNGVWEWPPYKFYVVFPQFCVNLFFIMTGFLFTRKMLMSGRKIPPLPFYLNRIRRLAPAYVASIVMVLIAMALPIGEHSLNELQIDDLKSFLLFSGLPSAGSINYAYWTLPLEWRFYLAVPFLALLTRFYWLIVPASLCFIYYDLNLALKFASGGLAAVLLYKISYARMLKNTLVDIGAIILIVCMSIQFTWGFGLYQTLLCAVFFFLIACGNSLLGFLTCRPVLLLGHISFSFYLLHCTLLYIIIRTVNLHTPVGSFSGPQYWLLVLLITTVLFLFSLLSYRWCEHPFLRKRSS